MILLSRSALVKKKNWEFYFFLQIIHCKNVKVVKQIKMVRSFFCIDYLNTETSGLDLCIQFHRKTMYFDGQSMSFSQN